MRFTVENASKEAKTATTLREMFTQLGRPTPEYLDSDAKVKKWATIVVTLALNTAAKARDIGRLMALLPELNVLKILGIESKDARQFVAEGESIVLLGFSIPRVELTDDKV